MNSPQFFRRGYRDPVVEYYFLPSNKNIRLTRRFGKVLVHHRGYDLYTRNSAWLPAPETFMDLATAEEFALALMRKPVPIRYEITATTSNRVCELPLHYRVA